VLGRRISNTFAHIETLGAESAIRSMAFACIRSRRCLRSWKQQHWMRRFDFDVEASVRLVMARRATDQSARRR
jgi:hypothetical protein